MSDKLMKEENLRSVNSHSRFGSIAVKALTYLFLIVMAIIVLFPPERYKASISFPTSS